MEERGSEGGQLSSTNPAKPAGTLALRNFTIPRKKRATGQVLLEPCPEESRDYSLIQSKLKEARLDMRKEHANAWLWKDVKLVQNEEFLKEYSEKRSEMRTKGRHGREMEERYCYLVASHETTTQIYRHGLRTETQQQYSLGKPSHGIYLFRHVDVALKHAASSSLTAKNLIVFKVLFGKVKKVTPTSDWNRTPDPMVTFDCHMSKEAVSHRESLSQQVLGSSVFLFDYNDNQELNSRPRQCLPYAVVSFVPAISATPPTSISPPVSPVKHPPSLSHGPLDHLRGCTVAKRRGKGENATVTFKHFSTPAQTGCPGPENTPPTPSTEMTTPPFQQYNQQNPLLFIPQQLHVPLYQTAGYFSPSLPYMDTSIPFQNFPNQSAFPSNGQLLNTPSIYRSNTSNGGVMPQTSTEKISTVVYSSRLVKDPRLSRQGSNPEQKGSEQDKANSSSETDNLRCQLRTQDGEDKNKSTGTVSCNTNFTQNVLEMGEEQSQDSHLKPSLEPESSPEHKNENMPSMKLFKMKFQKYSTYLKMTEDERQKSIWSQQGMTPEQKQLLIDRVHFYDTYYQKYKQGLLFQKDTATENVSSLSNMETEKSKPQQSHVSTLKESPLNTEESTDNLSQTRQSDASDVSADLENTERPTEDLIKDTEGTESTKTTKETEKKDPPPELQENVFQSAVEQPSISLEASLDQDSLSLKKGTSEKEEAVEIFSETDSQQTSSPSSCPSEQDNKVNTLQAAIESLPQSSTTATTQSTLIITNNTEENPELEFHITDTDVAHCVDISVLDDVSENNDLPTVTVEGLDQNHSESSTKNTSRGFLKCSKPDDTSEMSIEVKREELRQDNTIYSALYHRLQLDQLLPNLHGSGASPYKSYLRPKDLVTTPSINQLCGHLHETMPKEGFNKAEMQNLQNWEKSGEECHLTLMTMFQQVSARTERLSLSERFSKLRTTRNNKKHILDHGRTKKSTNNDTGHPITGDVKSHPECLPLSRHSNNNEKGSGIDNIKLIQLFSQRFNEARSLFGCKQLRGKRSKVLRRRNKPNSSVSSLNHSTHQRALHILRRHFGRRSNTKLSSNGIFQGPKVLCTKSTSSTSQSSDPQNHQNHDKGCENKPTQEEGKAHLSTEDNSCQDTPISESKSISQHDGVSHITPYQSTDISSNGNPQKIQGDILLDVKHSVTVDEVEPQERRTEDSSICPHEESFPITCSESTKDGGIAKAQPTKEAAPQKLSFVSATQVETDAEMCGTKEISTNYNVGACRDQSNPDQEVSGILSNPSSGNTSSSCTAKPQTVMTPDLPGLMNMDDIEAKKKRRFHDSVKDNTRSSGIESVVDLTASEETGETTGEMDSNFRIVSNDMCSLGNIRLARDNYLFARGQTLEVNRSSLETLRSPKNDFIPSLILHPNEMRVSSSQQNPNANSSTINSHLKTYHPDLPDTIAQDAREPVAVLPGNLHSTWQVQENKTTVPSTSTETQLISKLRDYLTRFEITVKKQESVNDSVKDTQEVPMAWITLDSTVHKKHLFDTRHYNRLDLANLQHPGKDCTLNYMLPSTANEQATGKVIVINDAATSPVTTPKRKISKGRHQPKSYTSKRTRRSKLARISPDSTSMLEPDQHPADSHSHLALQKDTSDQPQPQISTSVPNLQQLSQNHGTPVQHNQILFSQSLENLNGLSAQPIASQGPQLLDIADKLNEQSLYGKNDKNTYNQKQYSVTDISITLKLADHAVSVVDLCSLQLKCKSMLRYFISIFERDQKVPFLQSCISRNLILDKYLDHPPEPMELKFEALNSFLELQMMVEAYQFVENKINFLSRKATFRSLLWYDPSLYGELYKGAVGFQQQSSLFSSFQQGIATEGYRKLQEYYTAVSTLHQQLQDSPDTSYYMYLKSKRERLEVEAALRNPPDIKSFFLSVPVALMMNLGDTLESLEKSHRIVMSFVETPSDHLPGVFDVGKAEHLSIMCRYLQEKVIFLKSKEQISKVSWFGLEHLLYDASKLLVWRESEHGMSSEVLLQYKRSNPQIVYGVTEAGVPLVNKIEQHPAQPAERARITPEQQMVDGSKNYRDTHSEISTENTHSAQGNQTEESMKERNQQVRRRATHPPVRSNLTDGGLYLLNPVQPSVPAQLGNPTPLPAFSQQSNPVHWRMAGPQAWDWKPPGVGQTSKSTPEIRALLMSKRRMTITGTEPRVDLRTNPASTWLPPYNISPRAAERITLHHQPTLGAAHHSEHRKEQGSEAPVPLIKPIPLQCLPPDTSSLSVPHLPFPNTSNQLPSHKIPMPINYPYFLFNGKTYSAVTPSVPVPGPSLHTETQYHQPHPV